MTIPPLSSSEDESARSQMCADAGTHIPRSPDFLRLLNEWRANDVQDDDGYAMGLSDLLAIPRERTVTGALARMESLADFLSAATASPESLGVSQDEPKSSDPSTAWRGIETAPSAPSAPRAQLEYPYPPGGYYVANLGYGWGVYARGTDGITRRISGPFWRWITAERVASDLIRETRNAVDVERSQ